MNVEKDWAVSPEELELLAELEREERERWMADMEQDWDRYWNAVVTVLDGIADADAEWLTEALVVGDPMPDWLPVELLADIERIAKGGEKNA